MEDRFTRNLIKHFRKSRSQRALQVLMVNHQAAISFAASYLPNNIMDYEDKCQFGNEILIKAIEKGGFDLRKKIKFNTYLINMVRLRIIDEIRKIRKRKDGKYRVKVDLHENHSITSPDLSYEDKEQMDIMVQQIQKLPRTEQIIMGCLMQGMSQAEIAEQTNVTQGRISQIVSAATNKIKENVKNY